MTERGEKTKKNQKHKEISQHEQMLIFSYFKEIRIAPTTEYHFNICAGVCLCLLTLNIACNVRRCKSVNTSRGFFGDDKCSAIIGNSSFRLHAVNGMSEIKTEQEKRKSKNAMDERSFHHRIINGYFCVAATPQWG